MASQTAYNTPESGLLSSHIQQAIAEGILKADPAQQPAIAALDGILNELSRPCIDNKASALGWLFGKRKIIAPKGPTGLYIWGGVGRGKSMLMDLFFSLAPERINNKTKQRIHFHAFMQDVHQRIHQWRQKQKNQTKNRQKNKDSDPIPPLADAIADKIGLLCFDEFAVTDVADAMILARLFTRLFERGVIIIATSNVEPDQLYQHGLNRSFFLPFIELVKTRMQIEHLASATDYRMEKQPRHDVYLYGDDAHTRFNALWEEMTANLAQTQTTIDIAGRRLLFKNTRGGYLRSDFETLCDAPLGAGDYLAICARFHTLFIAGLRKLHHSDRNSVKRFITLIDTLYDAEKCIVIEASTPLTQIYTIDHGTEAFEFQRTLSRLQEMQSHAWQHNKKHSQ